MAEFDLEAIRARDAMFAHVPVERLVTQSMVDRRALLAAYDALRSRLADYELLKRAVNETGDCLPDCDSYAHNEQCPNVNNHVVLQDKQREIESLRARLAEDEVLIAKGLAVVHDFLPNIGRCVLQDYQRMNEFCCEAAARAAMKRPKTVSQWIGSKP